MNKLRWWTTLGVSLIVGLSVFSFAARYWQVLGDWASHDALVVVQERTIRFGRWIPVDRTPAKFRDSVAEALTDRARGIHLAVLDAEGKVLPEFTSPAFPAGDFSLPRTYLTNRPAWAEPHAAWVRGGGGRDRYAAAWFPLGHERHWQKDTAPRYWTLAAALESDSERRLSALGRSMLMRAVGLAVGCGVLTFLMVGLWTRALAVAADSAESIASGNLAMQRLELPRTDSELRRLVLAFNRLMDRLRQLHAAQEQFVADAAHELRTPLTILRGEIQVALRKERDPERYRKILESNLEEVVRLASLVEGLLTLARVDAGKGGAERRRFSVDAVAREVLEKLRGIAERRQVALEIEIPPQGDFALVGDAGSLHRVLFNLVENAVRYSSAGDSVRLVFDADEVEVRIRVGDAGPGIAAEHLPRLFDRFYRIESARDRASGGCGLGLAIVKALTEAEGGTVTVTSEIGRGTVFTVSWPRVPPAEGSHLE